MSKLTYLDDLEGKELQYKEELLPWQERGLMYTATGYGHKIPTTRKVLYNNRWYRVYCSIHSNSGVCYILSKGLTLYIRG